MVRSMVRLNLPISLFPYTSLHCAEVSPVATALSKTTAAHLQQQHATHYELFVVSQCTLACTLSATCPTAATTQNMLSQLAHPKIRCCLSKGGLPGIIITNVQAVLDCGNGSGVLAASRQLVSISCRVLICRCSTSRCWQMVTTLGHLIRSCGCSQQQQLFKKTKTAQQPRALTLVPDIET